MWDAPHSGVAEWCHWRFGHTSFTTFASLLCLLFPFLFHHNSHIIHITHAVCCYDVITHPLSLFLFIYLYLSRCLRFPFKLLYLYIADIPSMFHFSLIKTRYVSLCCHLLSPWYALITTTLLLCIIVPNSFISHCCYCNSRGPLVHSFTARAIGVVVWHQHHMCNIKVASQMWARCWNVRWCCFFSFSLTDFCLCTSFTHIYSLLHSFSPFTCQWHSQTLQLLLPPKLAQLLCICPIWNSSFDMPSKGPRGWGWAT